MLNWVISNLNTIFLILGAILSIVGVIFTLLGKPKLGKTLKATGSVVAHLPSFISTAEKLGGTGEEKKRYVLEQVYLYLKADGVTPDEDTILNISKQIDDIVKLTKELHVIGDNKNGY